MFCKCFFAALWDAAANIEKGGKNADAIEPRLKLRPVYLPTRSFLVESSDGWLASAYARFQQARRHSQGVAELGYVLLQYLRLICTAGFLQIPFCTHRQVVAIGLKMFVVHIFNSVQAFSLVVAILFVVPETLRWVLAGGAQELLTAVSSEGILNGTLHQPLGIARWALVAAFGPFPPMAVLIAFTLMWVISVASTPDAPAVTTMWRRVALLLWIQADMMGLGEPVIILYGFVPVTLAAWSLLSGGTKFEYIVAAKPT